MSVEPNIGINYVTLFGDLNEDSNVFMDFVDFFLLLIFNYSDCCILILYYYAVGFINVQDPLDSLINIWILLFPHAFVSH